jgi:hypothetical protein
MKSDPIRSLNDTNLNIPPSMGLGIKYVILANHLVSLTMDPWLMVRGVMVFNTTFNNISVISWQSVL